MGRFRLIDWMDNAPAPARASAVPALVRSYVHGDLTPDARDVIEAALTIIADDPSPDVRRALAEVKAGGQTGIVGDVPDGASLFGTPHLPHRDALRVHAEMKKLPETARLVRELARTGGEKR